MAVFSRAAERAAKTVKKGTMARNRKANQLAANRNAGSQGGLFAPDSRTRRDMTRATRGGSTRMSDQDLIRASDKAAALRQTNTERIGEIDRALASGPNTRAENIMLNKERRGLEQSAERARASQTSYMDALENGTTMYRDMGGLERAGVGARAAARYMWGGTAGQIAARNGVAIGGIYGANVGMDYLNNRGNGGGQSY